MPNREKVMGWLEGLSEPDWRDFHSDSEVQNIAKSALALLKEQGAVKIEVKKINNSGRCGRCTNCLMELNEVDYPEYCGNCGQKVKWNERCNF